MADGFDKNCVFCKIIRGEIPCHKIYEDKYVFAFLDITPIALGHTLIAPKKHFADVFDCGDEYLEKILPAIKKITAHYRETIGCDGFNILNANGKAAQQSVFHLHFHIVPRFYNDGYDAWPKTGYEKEDLAALSEKIKMKVKEK